VTSHSGHSKRPTAAGLVLAAGKGTRMKSALPKVLHPVAGRPMLAWVVSALSAAGAAPACVVLSEHHDSFAPFLAAHPEVRIAVQKNCLGTGDAVAAAAFAFAGATPAPYAAGALVHGAPIACDVVLIAAGDVPAVRGDELAAFLHAFHASGAAVGVLGMRMPQPKGYGRLVTDGGLLEAIVEERDADERIRRIDVCNSGVIAAKSRVLFPLLHALTQENAQREYYLTDIVRHARVRGLDLMVYTTDAWRDFAGVNNRAQLAEVEAWLIARERQALMAGGATLHLPETIYVEADVVVGADSEIGAGARLYAGTRLGAGVRVGPGVTVAGATVGDRAVLGAGSVIEKDCVIPAGSHVPPLSVRTALG